MHLKKLFILFLFTIGTVAEAAQSIRIYRGDSDLESGHFDAVGAVISVEGRTSSLGTGTYIGKKRILTAAHLFQSLLPYRVNARNGSVAIDLRDQKVYWTTEHYVGTGSPIRTKYRATKLIVSAVFINEFAGNSEPPNHDDIKSDMAILMLEEDPDLDPIELTTPFTALPSDGTLIGYGEDNTPGHEKHVRVQAIQGFHYLQDWGIILSNMPQHFTKSRPSFVSKDSKQIQRLLGKSRPDNIDVEITRATQGDSGGPLLVVDANEDIRIIGVMSAHSTNFNAFSSLVVLDRHRYKINRHFQSLLNNAR